MKIVIAGGHNEADFLIGSLLRKNHHLLVINSDQKYCDYLSTTHQIPIVLGDPCKQYVLEDAHVEGYDILIALRTADADNFAICQAAKRIYGIKKVVCTVTNPKNVDVFKKLGVNTVISAAHVVSTIIEQTTTIESLIQTLSIEDDKVVINEILVDINYPVVNQKMVDVHFPAGAIVGCIIRNKDIVVPSGQTVILPGDKLLVISSKQNSEAAIKAISTRGAKHDSAE